MKKSIAILLVLSLITLFSFGCDTDSTITQEDAGYFYGTLDAELYYPTTINGIIGGTSMSSGYTQGLGDIEWLSQEVAKAGYVVLAFTPDNTYGYVSQWRDLHKACIEELIELNDSHDKLKGKINTANLQCCGHSKGGGGTLWAAAQLGSQLKTAIGLAPYEEGFVDSTLGSVTAATMIQAGGSDTLATNSMTRGEYGGLGDISKAYFEYSGYGHLAWTTGGNDDWKNRISGDAIAWMKYYMDGQTSYASTLSDSSDTSRYEWIDLTGDDGGDDDTGGCN